MIDKKKFKAALANIFRDAGYLKKSQAFYLAGPDAVVVVSLQKSDYDEKYYLNFGIWIKKLGINEFPRENQCHIQVRFTSLFPEYADIFEKGCRIGSDTEDDLDNMVRLIRSECIPLLNDCLNEIALKNLILSGRFKKAMIIKEVKDIFSQQSQSGSG